MYVLTGILGDRPKRVSNILQQMADIESDLDFAKSALDEARVGYSKVDPPTFSYIEIGEHKYSLECRLAGAWYGDVYAVSKRSIEEQDCKKKSMRFALKLSYCKKISNAYKHGFLFDDPRKEIRAYQHILRTAPDIALLLPSATAHDAHADDASLECYCIVSPYCDGGSLLGAIGHHEDAFIPTARACAAHHTVGSSGPSPVKKNS